MSNDNKPRIVLTPARSAVSAQGGTLDVLIRVQAPERPADAERLTGYHVGGISPFGQKKTVPTAIEESALAEAQVYINGGQRGLQVRLAPKDALKVLKAAGAPLIA